MIRKIKFNNFYSFKTEQILDFTANKKTSYSYYNSEFGNQISKIIGFVGPNAAGKTNIIRLLSFIGYFITNGDDKQPDLSAAFKPFFNNKNVSNITVEFELEKTLFFYSFSIKDNLVVKESLEVKSVEKYSRKEKIFDRKSNGFDFLNKKYIGIAEKNSVDIKPNVSSIVFFNSLSEIKIIQTVYKYFSKFKTNINERGHINNIENQVSSLRLFLQDPEIAKEINDFISKFDLGLKAFDIREQTDFNEKKILASGVHNINGDNTALAFEYESRGTQLLFFNLVKILYAAKNDAYVVIDELEYGLHPEAFNKLISYFIDEKLNNSTQLFFSSHSLGFMKILDLHQIFLTEKNDNCESRVYRLNEVGGIRSDANYLAKYMSGAYGAFPRIRT